MGNCQARAEKGEVDFCDCIDENSKCNKRFFSETTSHQIDVNLPDILYCEKNGRHKWIHKTLNCPTDDKKKQAALGLCDQDDNYNYVKEKCGFQNIESFTPGYIASTHNILQRYIDKEHDIHFQNAINCKYNLNNKLNDYNKYLINAKSEYNSNDNCNKYKIPNKTCKTPEDCALLGYDVTSTCKKKSDCILNEFKRATGYQNINNIENNTIENNNIENNNIENNNIENNNLTYNIIYLLFIVFLLYICNLKKNIQTNLRKNILLIIIIIIILFFISLYINIKYA
jgi:hypothetical protein